MPSRPSTGRYFPIEPSRLVALTREWAFGASTGWEVRRLRNPVHSDATTEVLAVLRPGRDVTVYSLPVKIDLALGEQAVVKALEVLAAWKSAPGPLPGSARSIVVQLEGSTHVRVLDEHLKYARRKFGAGEGLSSSRKPRVTSRCVTKVAVLAIAGEQSDGTGP